ncbi:MAG TPA: biopolymer transporter ExbD [Planctomycetota bacterium]
MDMLKVAQQHVAIDMTPMIDCVFLLMIFFVLVIDLGQQNLEDLVLPRAVYRVPDDEPPKNRPVVNVLQNGTVVYRQRVVYEPALHGTDYGPIRELLLKIRAEGLANKSLELEKKMVGGKLVPLMDVPILIRADKWTEWRYIAEIMKQCSRADIAFWKVELALSEVDKETGEKNQKGARK